MSLPEQGFTSLKNCAVIPPASVLPQKIQPEDLSEERKNYLFREICQFCRPGTENLVAPAPQVSSKETKPLEMCILIVVIYFIISNCTLVLQCSLKMCL